MVITNAVVDTPTLPISIHNDPDVLAAAARMPGEDLCSIGDLTSAEVRAILKLGQDVKRHPGLYRRSLDARQMVMMFEKASLRTRLAFETGINTMGGNAIFVDQTNSPLGERETIADVAKQPRALGRRDRAAHLRARHHYRDGFERQSAGHQRAL